MTERQGEWDTMVWAKVDRAFRSAKDCADVAYWAEENHKVLVFTDDGITLDYREGWESSFGNELAKVFLMLVSIFAELELKRIKARVGTAHKHVRKTDRWAGGQPPYGYRIVDRSGGGRTLEPDSVTSEAVRYMGKLLLEGQSQWTIATGLEAAGFDTPSMHAFKNQGESYASKRKTAPSNHWDPTSVAKILRSPATMGLKLTGRSVKARKIARDAKGLPIQMAKPLFTEGEWAAIQAVMARAVHHQGTIERRLALARRAALRPLRRPVLPAGEPRQERQDLRVLPVREDGRQTGLQGPVHRGRSRHRGDRRPGGAVGRPGDDCAQVHPR